MPSSLTIIQEPRLEGILLAASLRDEAKAIDAADCASPRLELHMIRCCQTYVVMKQLSMLKGSCAKVRQVAALLIGRRLDFFVVVKLCGQG